ncbi:hypothetical protein BN405_2-10_Ab1_orf_64 [Pseudomonas phage vB_PaeM_C2-10_Ab1]|uniref:Uncharacterized protein n=1 Tax=Pseudomonas phage vB_PaeM_C2-10_Ab1 TaxID=1231048 RepID=K4RM37_9CAUD|nr:hypothetical protein BN405_2-10_Ab1_orf_64 [Pseudomonas phage vB_PaeM_C2-10_Ab1]CCM43608.1 unnamed protein product [Pseudomonas phage vB_PaeM_C2-10_Ab1]
MRICTSGLGREEVCRYKSCSFSLPRNLSSNLSLFHLTTLECRRVLAGSIASLGITFFGVSLFFLSGLSTLVNPNLDITSVCECHSLDCHTRLKAATCLGVFSERQVGEDASFDLIPDDTVSEVQQTEDLSITLHVDQLALNIISDFITLLREDSCRRNLRRNKLSNNFREDSARIKSRSCDNSRHTDRLSIHELFIVDLVCLGLVVVDNGPVQVEVCV